MSTLTDVEKMGRLRWLLAGDMLNSAFFSLTFTGPIFLLFLDELKLNAGEIGFTLALIPFAGIIAPFIAPIVARFGYKRVYLTFWTIRKFVISLLLLTPFIISQYGGQAAFFWVGGVILVFALCRAIAETGGYPWRKEAIPSSFQGKFSALSNMVMTFSSIVVTAGASYVLGWSTDLGRFMLLVVIGIGFGFISIWMYSHVPGGAPVPRNHASPGHLRGIQQALKDRDYLFFLSALGLATFGGTALISFIPLFMKQQIGLNDSQIVLLGIGTYMGALLPSYLWGWAADRYGSKPVMLFSLDLMLLLPFAWFLMPRHSWLSLPVAMLVAFVAGVSTLAWQISWTRYLFVNAMPATHRSAYTAIYYAWFGFVSGCAPLLAGQLLELTQGFEAKIALLELDAYTPLFGLSCLLLAAGIVAVAKLDSQEATPFRRFAGLFVRGNPIRALESVILYNFAGDEITRMATTARMGDAKNPLSTRELIEALRDPSFNVRYEAIHAVGRMLPEPELVDALIALLDEEESELTFAVTRSLGQLGDPKAIPPLRKLLFSGYHLIEANTARALAILGDRESIPHLLEKFRAEPNPVLQIAYASALGRLNATEATAELFILLRQTQAETLRGEIGLALARLAGDERYYMQQWRLLHADPTVAMAQAVLALQKSAKQGGYNQLTHLIQTCAENFARGDRTQAAISLKELICQLPKTELDPNLACIMQECATSLPEFGPTRLEFVLLSLHTLNIALSKLPSSRNGHPH
jgi:predicted MFS family arabinose efflux permease